MAKKPLVPESKGELDYLKMEVANELGLNPSASIDNPYMGNVTAKNAGLMAGIKNVGNVGGEMVKRMIAQAEMELANREKKNQ